MEHIRIELDQPAAFDELLKTGLPEGGDLRICTKDGATDGGKAAAVIAFSVMLPDGSRDEPSI